MTDKNTVNSAQSKPVRVDCGVKHRGAETRGWIPTFESLPAEGQEVTIYMFYGQIRQAVKDKNYAGGWKQRNCQGWEIVSWHATSITHWRPEIFERP